MNIGTPSGGVTERDPVCGMELDEFHVTAMSEYQGETYYFCSMKCKEEFDKNPDKYVNPERRERAS